MGATRQLRLLLWKNFVLQKRRPIATVFEVGLPIFFVFLLLLVHVYLIKPKFVGDSSWESFRISHIPVIPPIVGSFWKLAFTPDTSDVAKVMGNVANRLPVTVVGFPDEETMVRSLVSDEEKGDKNWEYIGGVVFTESPSTNDIKYKIRLSSSGKNNEHRFLRSLSTWHTKYVFPPLPSIGPRTNQSNYGGPPDYYKEGFLTLQHAIDLSIIEYKNGSFKSEDYALRMERFPYPAYLNDPFVVVIQTSLPFVLMLSLVYTALTIVRNIVYEKEKKLKESMKIMGLSGWLHWAAWFIKCLIFLLIPLVIITILLCAKFSSNGKMLNTSDGTLIFIFLVLYGMSTIMFCFLVSTFFYRANLAAAGGGILWFLSYVPNFFISNYYQYMSVGAKVAACLDFNVAMAFGSALIGKFEGRRIGVQWSNLYDGVTVDDKFAFGMVLAMLIADCLLYGILTWYIEAIFPGEYGFPLPWNFIFKKSYWYGMPEVDEIPLIGAEQKSMCSGEAENKEFLEKEPEDLKAGIRIQSLSKTFKTENDDVKVAVSGINLNMFEGQITSLLGHNGAGKTTTISMLTGLIPPTSGTATINGRDLRTNIRGVRKSLGICPQHNVLFDTLTVKEHLIFFARLKGLIKQTIIDIEVNRMLEATELVDKTNSLSRDLSGGMKRKLSVAIALIGDSKIVMLDEPTSGMDPSARRLTWDLLQREREGRTMLLTTHFMDEADILGDRIAIMANGTIKCCGSSLFLKNKYGVGYHMVMVKEQDCNVDKITNVVKGHVEGAMLENNVGMELSYVLPSRYSNKFEGLFAEIETRKAELGISSYGASITTLEEVFLKVSEESEGESVSDRLYRQLSSKSGSATRGDGLSNPTVEMEEGVEVKFHPREGTPALHNFAGECSSTESIPKNVGWNLFLQRWYAMFVKRLLHTKRYKMSLISQLVMPCLFTLFALIAAKTFPRPSNSPALTLSTSMFKQNYVPFSVEEGSDAADRFAVSYQRQFQGSQTETKNVSGDFGGNISRYLMDTASVDIGHFNIKYLLAYSLKPATKGFNSMVWFNNAAYHTPAVSLNAFDTGLLMYATNGAAKITTINHPLPKTTKEAINDASGNLLGFQISFNIVFGMAFLASSFVIFLVQERSTKAKHLQFVSGVDPISYWSSAYAWDMINYLVPMILVIIIIAAFQVDEYSGERIGYMTLLLLFFGWAVIPLMYLFSFLFSVASTAYVRLTMLNVLTGLATLLAVNILSIPALDLVNVAEALKYVFLIFPNFSLGQGISDIYLNYQYISQYNKGIALCMKTIPNKAICTKFVKERFDSFTPKMVFQENYLAWDNPGIGRYLIFMAAEGFLFFALVILIEYRLFVLLCKGYEKTMPNFLYPGFVDSDVDAEKERVLSGNTKDDVLVTKNLTKVFGYTQKLVAVDRLCLGVPQGECFGLLGLNGAGKTTTFRMLTGDESITYGTVTIAGLDVSTNMAKVRQQLGYCPQFDALIDLLTGRELLTMFARLRGVLESRIKQLVHDSASMLILDEHIDKISKAYSGGNKRKLSTCISLIGDPPVVFLDEPTTGMDPGARRMVWDALSRQREEGRSIVITTHSMEECEALCTRLAIMVNGQFKCLGSPQHLKSKFGEGYTVLAKLENSRYDSLPFKNFIERTFPGSVLKDEHQGYVHYQIIDMSKTWANIFGILEAAKREFNLQSYSVSQTTLEQVFLNFAKHQREDEN